MQQLQPGCQIEALFDYSGLTSAELSFNAGDIFYFCTVNQSGWAKGERQHQRGWFPVSYVKKAPESSGERDNSPNIPIRPRVPPRRDTKTLSVENREGVEDSILQNKERICAILDNWLPTRVNIHETTTNTPASLQRDAPKKRQVILRLVGKGKSNNPVFNLALSDLQRNGRDIPLIVIQCISYLSNPRKLLLFFIFDGLFFFFNFYFHY